MVFAILVNLNLNIKKDESAAINLKLISNQAKADYPPDVYCATPWGYGITTLYECNPCVQVHWRWIWTDASRCIPQ